jgi:hypothetical protein
VTEGQSLPKARYSNKEARSDYFDFPKTKVTPLKPGRPSHGQTVTPLSADSLLEPYQEQSKIGSSLKRLKSFCSIRPATRQLSTVGREAILFRIVLAHLRASLLDRYVMLRAERLQAMADPVIPVSIRSYHCHESGCYARYAFGCRNLGCEVTWEMSVVYIILH